MALSEQAARVENAIRQRAPVPQDAGTLDSARFQAVSAQLADLLADSDPMASDVWQEHAALLRAGLGERFRPIARALESYDFEAALAELRGTAVDAG